VYPLHVNDSLSSNGAGETRKLTNCSKRDRYSWSATLSNLAASGKALAKKGSHLVSTVPKERSMTSGALLDLSSALSSQGVGARGHVLNFVQSLGQLLAVSPQRLQTQRMTRRPA
jgi:hypothetical protein